MPVFGTIYLNIAFLLKFCNGSLCTGCSMKGAAYCSFVKAPLSNYFGKVSLIMFISTLSKMLKHCIFVEFFSDRKLSTRYSRKGAAHCSFCRALLNSYIGKVSLINFVTTWKNLLKICISPEFLLIKGYVQGTLWKELNIAPYIDLFKTTTSGESHW